jgi:hypothetical protein
MDSDIVSGVDYSSIEGTVYILDSKLVVYFMFWYIHLLPDWSGAEINCTLHVGLPKRPIN